MNDFLRQLKTVAASYGGAKKLSQARVSTLVFGDGTKLKAIVSDDRDLTTSRFSNAMQWFSDNWPPTAVWPDDVPRPTSKEEVA